MKIEARKKTKQVRYGDVAVGGDAPISIQSMCTCPASSIDAVLGEIRALAEAGCEIVRVSVKDGSDIDALRRISDASDIPVIADIHFDWRLAVESANQGVAGLRINPGNIGSKKRIKAVVDCAKANDIPIRIGVNAGSLEKDLIDKHGGVTVAELVERAVKQIYLIASLYFFNIIYNPLKSHCLYYAIKGIKPNLRFFRSFSIFFPSPVS